MSDLEKHTIGFLGDDDSPDGGGIGEFYAAADVDKRLSTLTAENARLRQRAEKAEDERDRLQARLDTAEAHVEELRGQRDEARRFYYRAADKRDAMRPVVEAAEALVEDWAFGRSTSGHRLIAAVDTWRAAQPDQTACTCPWNNGYHVGNPLGHHVSCPSLQQVHTPDDDCQRTGVPGAGHVDQDAPTDRPSATESQDQGADDGAGT